MKKEKTIKMAVQPYERYCDVDDPTKSDHQKFNAHISNVIGQSLKISTTEGKLDSHVYKFTLLNMIRRIRFNAEEKLFIECYNECLIALLFAIYTPVSDSFLDDKVYEQILYDSRYEKQSFNKFYATEIHLFNYFRIEEGWTDSLKCKKSKMHDEIGRKKLSTEERKVFWWDQNDLVCILLAMAVRFAYKCGKMSDAAKFARAMNRVGTSSNLLCYTILYGNEQTTMDQFPLDHHIIWDTVESFCYMAKLKEQNLVTSWDDSISSKLLETIQ